jgi:hypothetical protein
MPSLHQKLTLLHEFLAVPCILTISQNHMMTMILPTISTAHSTSSSERPLTLLHKLLIVLCTLMISQNQMMTTNLPTISTAHSTSSRLMVVHLAPAWHFPSGHSCLRMRKTFETSSQTRQKTFSNLRASRCRINQDPGDWYLRMAAFARQHLLPFWKLHVTLFLESGTWWQHSLANTYSHLETTRYII